MCVCYIESIIESSLQSLRAVGGLCLEVSLGTWEPDILFLLSFFFRSEMTSCFVSQKNDKRNGSGSHAPSKTSRHTVDHLLPGNLAARPLRSVEHTSCKFGREPCPVRRGFIAAVKCFVQKTFFFPSFGTKKKLIALCRFQHHKGEILFCFPFSDPTSVAPTQQHTLHIRHTTYT